MSSPLGESAPTAAASRPTETSRDPRLPWTRRCWNGSWKKRCPTEPCRTSIQSNSERWPKLPRQYPGASLVADPIAAELVESVLKARFRGIQASATFWQQVSRQIATTLCEAPDTQEKLDRLWNQLSELVT